MTAQAKRRDMKREVTIGQRWRRRRDKTVWTIVQIHRPDRLVELDPVSFEPGASSRITVTLTDLATKWERLDPPPKW